MPGWRHCEMLGRMRWDKRISRLDIGVTVLGNAPKRLNCSDVLVMASVLAARSACRWIGWVQAVKLRRHASYMDAKNIFPDCSLCMSSRTA